MELNGDLHLAAPRARVWEGLNDAEILVRCIPGCESMEVTSPTERTARVAVKVGPVRAKFSGHVRMEDIRPGEGCSLIFEGSGGAAGMAKGQSAISLADEDGGTRLRYTVQASVGGKLGQVGGRMIDTAAKQMADQFFAAFQEAVAPPAVEEVEAAAVIAMAPAPEAPAPAEAVAPAAPAQPEEAAGVAPAGGATPAMPAAVEAVALPATVAAPAPTPAAPAPAASAASATAPVSPAPPRIVRAPAPPAPPPVGEGVRVLWFVLGALSTGFGVWIASLISH